MANASNSRNAAFNSDVITPSLPEVSRGALQKAFSFPVMLGGILVGIVFVSKRNFDVDSDLWWHLAVGREILATHRWPTTDSHSFTAGGQPWIAAEWLAEILFSTVERIGGLWALGLLLVILSAAVILSAYGLGSLCSGNSKAGFGAVFALAPLSTVVLNFRPQMFGFLFLLLTLIALEHFRRGHGKAIWFLPPLFIIWVNTHGSWVIGLFAIFVYWVSGFKTFRLGGMEMRAWKPIERERISMIILLCILVLPITPYGTRLAAFPFQFINALPVNMSSIAEWQPMPFDLVQAKLLLGLVLGLFIFQLVHKPVWRLEQLVLFFFGTIMACLHARFVLIFVPFCVPLLSTSLARWLPEYRPNLDKFFLNALLLLAMSTALIHYFPSQIEIEENVANSYPVGAVTYLRSHAMPRRTLNTYGFGGYLEWSDGRADKVFIDGRGELYEPAGVFSDYMYMTLLKPGVLEVLRNYQIDSCLLNRDHPLGVLLGVLPEWTTVYSDKVSVILQRNKTASAQLAVDSSRAAVLK